MQVWIYSTGLYWLCALGLQRNNSHDVSKHTFQLSVSHLTGQIFVCFNPYSSCVLHHKYNYSDCVQDSAKT